jgi:WD40 repeat protein/energy-coupling factor transporter ATP-binding protein EcfA2
MNFAKEVQEWLHGSGHDVFLDQDRDAGIEPGESWRQRLYTELERADAVICVVTAANAASVWCAAEVTAAKDQGCRVIPLRYEAGVRHPLIEPLQYIDCLADPGDARSRLLAVLRGIDGAGRTTWRAGDNPYPGLRPFTAADSRVFFGRTTESRELGARLRAGGEGARGRLLAVFGPSGCGKSSLVRAGLLPRLRDDPRWLVCPPWTPGADPVSALGRALTAAARERGLERSATEIGGTLLAGPDGLSSIATDLLCAQPGRPERRLLLTIDQAEELVTRGEPTAVRRLGGLLRAATDGPVHVLVTARSEYLDPLLALPGLDKIPAESYRLRQLTRDVLPAVIETPARIAGLRIDPGLVTRMVTDTPHGAALPLLAFTLRELADGLSAGGVLTQAHYDQLHGVAGALAQHADEALVAAVAASGLDRQAVLDGLLHLVTVDEAGGLARHTLRRDAFGDQMREAIAVFVDKRLLTADKADNAAFDRTADEVWISVAHEALFTAWAPLGDVINQRRSALLTAQSVEHAADEWAAAEQHDAKAARTDGDAQAPTYLWEDRRLAVALDDLGLGTVSGASIEPSAAVVTLTATGERFLRENVGHARAERARTRRRRNQTVSVLSALLVLALLAASLAGWQQRTARAAQLRAQTAQRAAIAQAMTTKGDAILAEDPANALRLKAAAYTVDHSDRSLASLTDALAVTPYTAIMTGHTNEVGSAAVSPDGRLLATGGGVSDEEIILWDVADRSRPSLLATLHPHHHWVKAIAFSPDGKTLAAGNGDYSVVTVDIADPRRPHLLATMHRDNTVAAVAFSPDGQTLASGGYDKAVTLWNLTDPAHPSVASTMAKADAVTAIAFSPDGRTMAATDNMATLWNVTDRAQPARLADLPLAHREATVSLAFSLDGRRVATGSNPDHVYLWAVTNPRRPLVLTELTAPGGLVGGAATGVALLAFRPDGRALAAGNADSLAVLDISVPSRPVTLRALGGYLGSVDTVTFDQRGRLLISGHVSRHIVLFDPDAVAVPRQLSLSPAATPQESTAISADLRLVANLRDRNLTAASLSTDLAAVTGPAAGGGPVPASYDRGLAISPQGRTIAGFPFSSPDVSVFEVTGGAPLERRAVFPAGVGSLNWVAFAPDGRTLAVAGDGGNLAALWDLSDLAQPRRLSVLSLTEGGSSVVFSPDGRTVAAADRDGTVKLWDATDRRHPRVIGGITTGKISPRLVFASGGRMVAADGSIWNVANPAQPRPLGPVNDETVLAFSPDGRTAATGATESITLWDLSDNKQPRRLAVLPLPDAGGRAVWFSADGRKFSAFVAGPSTPRADPRVMTWDLSILGDRARHATELACDRAGGFLPPSGWADYAAQLTYQNPCPVSSAG